MSLKLSYSDPKTFCETIVFLARLAIFDFHAQNRETTT